MNSKLNLFFMALVFAGLAVFLAEEGSEAFCVNNETDIKINAQQTSNHVMFRGFTKDIKPGEEQCCSWEDKTCNKEGKKDSQTTFRISYPQDGMASGVPPVICGAVQITADGNITVKGKDYKYQCEKGE